MNSIIRRSPEFTRLYRDSAAHAPPPRHHIPCTACSPGEWELGCEGAPAGHKHNDRCYRRILCHQDIDVLRGLDRVLYGGIVAHEQIS